MVNPDDTAKGKGKVRAAPAHEESSRIATSTSTLTSSLSSSQPPAQSHNTGPAYDGGAGRRAPPAYAGVRAGGIAAELAGLLRSSGKAGGGAAASGPSGGLGRLGFGAAGAGGSALGDALDGVGAGAGGGAALGQAGAAFRRLGTDGGHGSGAMGSSEHEAAATSFFASDSQHAGALAGTSVSAGRQHPMLRPGAPLSPRLAAYREALRGPWSAASDLDGELHKHTRRASAVGSLTERSLDSAMEGHDELGAGWADELASMGRGVVEHDEAQLEAAWRRYAGDGSGGDGGMATSSGQEAAAQRSDGALFQGGETDFFATLEAEERQEAALAQARPRQAPAPDNALSQDASLAQLGLDANRLPNGITSEWRPPSPSRPPDVSVEQLLLHHSLAAKQEAGPAEDEDRARERIKPADDDERERQGVYAATPEDALRAVWDGPGEAERVRRDKERRLAELAAKQRKGETTTTEGGLDVERLIAEVKQWYPRGSYAEEVHGMPPLLAQTLADAELPAEETDPDLVERRLAAIRRLETMRTHLIGARRGAGAAGSPAGSSAYTSQALAAAFERARLD